MFIKNTSFNASLVLSIALFFNAGINYLTTPLFTRLLTSEEFGKFHVYLTWKSILGIITMYCLSYGIYNNALCDYPERRDELSFSMLSLSNIITTSTLAIFLIAFAIFGKSIQLSCSMIIVMFLVFFTQPAYNFWLVRQRYELKAKIPAIVMIVSVLISQSLSILCVILFPDSRLSSKILGAEIPLIITYFLFYLHLGKKVQWTYSSIYWKEALKFNTPLIPHYLSLYLLSSVDKVMISQNCGDSYTAFYSIALSISSIILLFWTAINSSLVPYTYENCKNKNYDNIYRIADIFIYSIVYVCLGIELVAPEIVSFLAPAEYAESRVLIPPIIVGIFFQVLYFLFANILFYHKKTKYIMIGSIVSCLLKIGLNAVLIPHFGYTVAAYTTLLCYFLQALIDFSFMYFVLKRSFYNIRHICISSVILILSIYFSVFLFNHTLLRFFALFIILVIPFIFLKRIILILKSYSII